MSLINDMLRDLDQRQNQQRPLPHQLPRVAQPQAAPRRWLLPVTAGLLLVVLLATAWVWLQMPTWKQQREVASGTLPKPAATMPTKELSAAPEVQAPVQPSPSATAATAATAASAAPLPSATSAQHQEVASVTAAAPVAVTTAVPAQASSVPEAVTTTTAETAVASTPPVKTTADIDSRQTPATDQKPSQAIAASTPAAHPAAVAQSHPVQAKPTARVAKTPAPAKPVAVASAEPVTADLNVVAEAPKAEVQTAANHDALPASMEKTPLRTLAQEDGQVLAAARQLYESGDNLAAENQLRRFVAQQPRAVQSRAQLVRWLLESDRTDEAAGLLGAVNEASPPTLKMLQARLWLSQGDSRQALELLQQNVPPLADNLDYHALMAALLQQNGRFTDAVNAYAELVTTRPSMADWWAGLGIALEAEGKAEPALRAYRQALSLQGLNPQLQSYIQGKLSPQS